MACRLRWQGKQNAHDRGPRAVLQLDQRRVGKDRRGRGAKRAAVDQDGYFDLTVGVVEIAAAVASVDRRSDAGDLVDAGDHPRSYKVSGEQVSVGVDVGPDMVSDASVLVTEADAAIEGRRPEPDRPTLFAAVEHLPEADMVTPVGASAGRFLECKILPLALTVERTHRRFVIRPVEHDAPDNLDARTRRNWIGRKPLRGMHGAEQILFGTNRADIDRIGRNLVACAREHRQPGKAFLMLIVPPQ